MMVGLSVSYSLLLVNFANRLLAEGVAFEEAILRAATIRLRPILMTSAAAILASSPWRYTPGRLICRSRGPSSVACRYRWR
jgi:multidrug efflux pump